MKRLVTVVFLTCLTVANACWFQERADAANKIVAFALKHRFPVEKGCTDKDLTKAIEKLPKAMAWVIKKADGPKAIMARCDLNKDGKITQDEIYMESDCLNACWKQVAIQTFL